MRPHRKCRTIIFCVLFASYRKIQARNIKKTLFNSPSHRNALTRLSSRLYTDENLQGTTSCVQLGLRNMICVYNEGRQADLPFYDDQQNSDEHFNIWPELEEEPDQPEEFVDLTRVDQDNRGLHSVGRSLYDIDGSFSEDYLDVGDLSITRKVDTSNLYTPRTYRELTIILTSPSRNKSYGRRIFSFPDPKILNFLSLKSTNNEDREREDRENTSAEEDDSSDDDDSSPKRFEVIKHSDSSEESDEKPKKPPKRAPKKGQNEDDKAQTGKSNYVYMQGPSRLLSPDRRRLPHFLPKQHHWNEEDIFKLPVLWFHGPQGQFSGIYRKPL